MQEKTLRLVNFLIDTLFFFLILLIFLLAFDKYIELKDIKWIAIIMYFLYYFLFEYILGQTIGKIITKSKVISNSGNKNYYFFRIFGRTLMRFIFFDCLTFLFLSKGLHDYVSQTTITKL